MSSPRSHSGPENVDARAAPLVTDQYGTMSELKAEGAIVKIGMPWPGPELAAEAEQAGIGAFCTGEFVDHEAYTTLAEMVHSTESALVGPAIAYAFARTPYAHAAAIRSLAPRAGGRLFLGLGSGAAKINRDWFGVPPDRPVERMADLVAAIRVWLHAENGRPVRHE